MSSAVLCEATLVGMFSRRSQKELSGLEALFLYCLRGILEAHFHYSDTVSNDPNAQAGKTSRIESTLDLLLDHHSTHLSSPARLIWNTVVAAVLEPLEAELSTFESTANTQPAPPTYEVPLVNVEAPPQRRTLKLGLAKSVALLSRAGGATTTSGSASPHTTILSRCWAILTVCAEEIVARRYDFHSEEFDGLWVRMRRALEMRVSTIGVQLTSILSNNTEKGELRATMGNLSTSSTEGSPIMAHLRSMIAKGMTSTSSSIAAPAPPQTLLDRYLVEVLTFSFADLTSKGSTNALDSSDTTDKQRSLAAALSRHVVLNTIDRLWSADIRPPTNGSNIHSEQDAGGTSGMFLLPVSDAIANGYSAKVTNPMAVAMLYDRARGGYSPYVYAGKGSVSKDLESLMANAATNEDQKSVLVLVAGLHPLLSSASSKALVEISGILELYEDVKTMAKNASIFNGAESWLSSSGKQLGLTWIFDRSFKKPCEFLLSLLSTVPLSPPKDTGSASSNQTLTDDLLVNVIVQWATSPFVLPHGPLLRLQNKPTSTIVFLEEAERLWSQYERKPLSFEELREGPSPSLNLPSEDPINPSLRATVPAPMFVYVTDFTGESFTTFRLNNLGILKKSAHPIFSTDFGFAAQPLPPKILPSETKPNSASTSASAAVVEKSSATRTRSAAKALEEQQKVQSIEPNGKGTARTRSAIKAIEKQQQNEEAEVDPIAEPVRKGKVSRLSADTKDAISSVSTKSVKSKADLKESPAAVAVEATAYWAQCDLCDKWRLTPFELTDPRYARYIKKYNKKGEPSWSCDCTPGRKCKDKSDENLSPQAQRELILGMRDRVQTEESEKVTDVNPVGAKGKTKNNSVNTDIPDVKVAARRRKADSPKTSAPSSDRSTSSSSSSATSEQSSDNGRRKGKKFGRAAKGDTMSHKATIDKIRGFLDDEDEDLLLSAFVEGGGPKRKGGRRRETKSINEEVANTTANRSQRLAKKYERQRLELEAEMDNSSPATTTGSSQPFGTGAGTAFDSILFHDLDEGNLPVKGPVQPAKQTAHNGNGIPPSTSTLEGTINSGGGRRLALSALRAKNAPAPPLLPPPVIQEEAMVPSLSAPRPLPSNATTNPNEATRIRPQKDVKAPITIATLHNKSSSETKHSKSEKKGAPTSSVNKRREAHFDEDYNTGNVTDDIQFTSEPKRKAILVSDEEYIKVERLIASLESQMGKAAGGSSQKDRHGSPAFGPSATLAATSRRPVPHAFIHFKSPPPLILKAGGTLALFKAAGSNTNGHLYAPILHLLGSNFNQTSLNHNTMLLWNDRDNYFHKVLMRRPGSAYFWFLHEDPILTVAPHGSEKSASTTTSGGKVTTPSSVALQLPPPITLTPSQASDIISAQRTLLRLIERCRELLGQK